MKNLSQIIKIYIVASDSKFIEIALNESLRPAPYFPGGRFLVDISNNVKTTKDFEQITFVTKNIPNHTLKIHVEDKNMLCNRPLASNKMLFSGDKIEIQMKKKFVTTYIITLG